MVQDPLLPLVEFDPGRPWFNFSDVLVNIQLIGIWPVKLGFLTVVVVAVLLCRFIDCVLFSLKILYHYGVWSVKYVCNLCQS